MTVLQWYSACLQERYEVAGSHYSSQFFCLYTTAFLYSTLISWLKPETWPAARQRRINGFGLQCATTTLLLCRLDCISRRPRDRLAAFHPFIPVRILHRVKPLNPFFYTLTDWTLQRFPRLAISIVPRMNTICLQTRGSSSHFHFIAIFAQCDVLTRNTCSLSPCFFCITFTRKATEVSVEIFQATYILL